MTNQTEHYLNISDEEKFDLLVSAAEKTGKNINVLEKDIWLCLALKELFALPASKAMVFKGETSLSKVYKVIERFSEDIDITIDYQSLLPGVPSLAELEAQSKTQQKKLSDRLRVVLIEHVTTNIVPSLKEILNKNIKGDSVTLNISDDAERLLISYPSVTENSDPYITKSILIEFGGRNNITPNSIQKISPELSAEFPSLSFPDAEVSVLAPERVFWEKVTLIHARCHRLDFPTKPERISRHWYDLIKLFDHPIGKNALSSGTEIWENVLRINQIFFRSSFSNFEKCLTGDLRLVPGKDLCRALNEDYRDMQNAGMFYGEIPPFEYIMKRLGELEQEINQMVMDQYKPMIHRLKA